MSGTPGNLRIGDVDVYIDYADGEGEQHLGYTLGGAEFTFERSFQDLTADQHGSTPIDAALTGQNLMIKCFLAEPTTKTMSRAIPEGAYAENEGDSKLGLGRDSGDLLSQYAGLLRLHPRRLPPDNRNEDIYIWKAVSYEPVETGFKTDEQRIVETTYRAFVDTTKEDGSRLGQVGDVDIS